MQYFIALVLACLSLTAQAQNPTQELDAALQQAHARHLPVLVDFHAPWCYSCYYMKKNVLNGPEWEKVERSAVVVELDADAPEGAYWREQWSVKALPTYIVLNEQGHELGRISAEKTRADFYRQLSLITGKQSTLLALQSIAISGGVAGAAAAADVLQAYYARRDAAAALNWFATLPQAALTSASADSRVALWLQRLRLQRSANAGDAAACLQNGATVLSAPLGCDYAYELDSVMQCTSAAAQEARPLLAAQRPRMEALIKQGAFGKSRCADQRSLVLTAADLYAALGDATAESKVLTRAVADTRQRIGGKLGRDRNLADNLRVYLERAGDTAAFDQLLPQLIAAYPDDYVYAYRYGKNLLAREKPEQALPYLEQSAQKAYGINRLKVAEQRVMALQKLKRADEARQVVGAALKDNGPWFPEEAQKLKALLGT